MLFKKLIRTFFKYKAQFISMIIMVILGIAIFVGFNAEWYSIDKDTSAFFDETNFATYRIYNDKKPFSLEDLDKIKKIDGVSKATRYISIDVSETRENDIIKLTVSENFTVSSFALQDGKEYDSNDENGIWLSKNYASRNNYKIGDVIELKYGNIVRQLTIRCICLSGEYLINTHNDALMPDFDKVGYAYTTPAFYEKLSTDIFGSVYYPQINVISSSNKEEFSTNVDKALNTTLQVIPLDDVVSYSQAKGESDEGKTMGSVLPVIFLLIAILTMVTTMNRITSNEKVQIGILKALGFKNKRILWHYTSYAFTIGAIGGVIGLILGFAISKIFFSPTGSMGTYFEMPDWSIHMPYFVYIGIILIVAFLTLIGYLSVKRQLRGSAASALRPYEPKKMKNLIIEKTKLFNKLNFVARYNLRDSFRHIARLAMSIFGVFGCTLLLFATFGMKSTMDNFIDTNYDVVMNYESTLAISEKTTNEEAISLAKDYKGDYSSSLATKVEGTTYALTILNNDFDKVRLLKKKEAIHKLDNSGVYICERMATALKLKVGDTFTFSIYGKKETYEVKVIEIVSSNTNGFTMTYDLASKLNLNYKINKIYTDIKKENITTDEQIVSISTKEDLMKTFDTFFEIMNLMIYVLVIFSLLLAFVVLYNLGTLSYIERYHELATLKVLGFKCKKIRWVLISQNISTSIIGIIIGCPVGYLTLNVLYKLLASEYELVVTCSWYVYVASIALTLVTSIIVSSLASLKVKKINMVEALKAE